MYDLFNLTKTMLTKLQLLICCVPDLGIVVVLQASFLPKMLLREQVCTFCDELAQQPKIGSEVFALTGVVVIKR